MTKLTGIIVLAAAALAAGCLRKDTTHTLYLTPDGRLTWMAVERDVRSDEQDAARRAAEEQAYVVAAGQGTHPVGRGLAALSPEGMQTRIVRGDRPYLVVTAAEFSSLEIAVRQLLAQLDVEAEVAVTHDGPATTIRVRIDAVDAVEGDREKQADGESAVAALFEDLERYRVVMTGGRFVAATGFELREDGTAAVPVQTPWETILANGGVLELSLTWK
jgi:hypothetical protein